MPHILVELTSSPQILKKAQREGFDLVILGAARPKTKRSRFWPRQLGELPSVPEFPALSLDGCEDQSHSVCSLGNSFAHSSWHRRSTRVLPSADTHTRSS